MFTGVHHYNGPGRDLSVFSLPVLQWCSKTRNISGFLLPASSNAIVQIRHKAGKNLGRPVYRRSRVTVWSIGIDLNVYMYTY